MEARCLLVVMLLGCQLSSGPTPRDVEQNYYRAVRDGLAKISEARELARVFGDANHFIGYHGVTAPETWNTKVFVHDRYVISMQLPIRVSDNFSTVVEIVDEPTFYLNEVQTIQVENGIPFTTFSQGVTFSRNEWQQIMQSNGDFSIVLDGPMKTNQPIPNFSVYQAGEVAQRLRVHESGGRLTDH